MYMFHVYFFSILRSDCIVSDHEMNMDILFFIFSRYFLVSESDLMQ